MSNKKNNSKKNNSEEKLGTEEEIKVILIGESGTGKTSLISGTQNIPFYEGSQLSTLICSYTKLNLEIHGKTYPLLLWDTMGQEKFRSLTKIFLNDSKIVIFVFDITNIASFNELDYWFEIVENELGPKIIKGIAANKKDLMDEQQVEGNLIEEYAKKKGVNYSYTTATNIEDFKILLKNLVKLYIDKKYESENKKEVRITPAKIRKKYAKKKKCC